MSILEHAHAELTAINFGDEDTKVMLDLLERFLDQWDSGGAVHAVAPVFVRLLSGQPLGPLTGDDSEWFDPMGDGIMLQNKRLGARATTLSSTSRRRTVSVTRRSASTGTETLATTSASTAWPVCTSSITSRKRALKDQDMSLYASILGNVTLVLIAIGGWKTFTWLIDA